MCLGAAGRLVAPAESLSTSGRSDSVKMLVLPLLILPSRNSMCHENTRVGRCVHPGNVSVGREMAFGAALGSREGRCLRTGEEREEEGRTLREPNLKVRFHDPRRPRGSARARDDCQPVGE